MNLWRLMIVYGSETMIVVTRQIVYYKCNIRTPYISIKQSVTSLNRLQEVVCQRNRIRLLCGKVGELRTTPRSTLKGLFKAGALSPRPLTTNRRRLSKVFFEAARANQAFGPQPSNASKCCNDRYLMYEMCM